MNKGAGIREAIMLIWLPVLLCTAHLLLFPLCLTPDSCEYLSAAESFSQDGRLLGTAGNVLLNRPPLYSILLAPAFIFNISALKWAAFLNFIAFVVFSYGLLKLFERDMVNRKLILIPLLLYPVFYFSTVLLTELIFMMFMALWLIKLKRYLEFFQRRDLLLMSLFLVCMFYTRYIGLIIILITGLILFYESLKKHRKRAVSRIILYYTLTLTPCLLWQLFVYKHSNGHLESRPWSLGVGQNLIDFFHSVAQWVFFNIPLPFYLMVMLGALLFSAYFLIVRRMTFRDVSFVRSFLIICVLYVLFLLFYTYYWIPGDLFRYSSILAPFLISLPLMVKARKRIIILLAILLAAGHSFYFIYKAGGRGLGYNSQEFSVLKKETLLAYNASLSNATDLYFLKTGQRIGRVPLKNVSGPLESGTRIIWFRSVHRDYLWSLERTMQAGNSIKLVHDSPDGYLVFEIQRKNQPL